MTLTLDVHEVASRLDELLAAVEAGGEAILARAEPLAQVTKAETAAPKLDAARAIAEIRAGRKAFGLTTIEEILEWRDEGRR